MARAIPGSSRWGSGAEVLEAMGIIVLRCDTPEDVVPTASPR